MSLRPWWPDSHKTVSGEAGTVHGYTRGNLSSITYYGAPSQGYAVTAVYPSSCAPPASPKTCNQASSITDANGNTTNYTYDDDTGQVLTITHPPNKRGVRAKTTYEYGKFGARYHDVNGIWVGQQPEWNKISLKTKETQCIDTDTQGTCTGGEVVTTFEYNHDNLLLTGMLVTDQFGATRRTCYRYDIFGNQIAVTTPNANLASCPAGSAP